MLVCERMRLGAPDESGRRAPEPTGEQFSIPCDLVISAVGERVDAALMAENGIEMGRKGVPFVTNVEGVWCAGDAHRGPATIVEGIADAAAFAEAVTGHQHVYEIPAEAFADRWEAGLKKGALCTASDASQEGERCLQCGLICENCVDSCPNRANVVVRLRDHSRQIVHVDRLCNECGNCTAFCPYDAEPCHDKFTLFTTEQEMSESANAGVLFEQNGALRLRLRDEIPVRNYSAEEVPTALPEELRELILTLRDRYAHLRCQA